MKIITVPVREFALPSPRTGGIDAYSGYGRAAAEGREIHVRVQKKKGKADPLYESEVRISCEFERGPYLFRIDGRIDGIFRYSIPLIEEIKSSFDITELARRLRQMPFEHPYSLQLMSYGYFFMRESGALPRISFHLVSSRNRDSLDLELELAVPLYENWLEKRLAELSEEAALAEKRAARRRKTATEFSFPFQKPRPGQVDLIREVESGLAEGERMLIQAPTGLGKTVGVLYPVLKEALGRGQTVFYVTPKNSQHSVAEHAVQLFQDSGSRLRCLSVTAKAKICPKEEPVCDSDFCEYAESYYQKLAEHKVVDELSRKRRLKARTFRETGEKYRVCPFELQLDSVNDADLVICDYNYVFAPRSAFGRLSGIEVDRSGKPNLVIDEVHNLPSRAMDYYSPSLATTDLESLREGILNLPSPFRRQAEELLNLCIGIIISCRSGSGLGSSRITPAFEPFAEMELRLGGLLSRYMESGAGVGFRDPVIRLCSCWSGFTEALELALAPERDEFFVTWTSGRSGGTVRITCCDASSFLEGCYDSYQHVIGFSATLKPFDFYASLSGMTRRKLRTAEFPSPFPREMRKLMIIPQISTKYSDRNRNYAKIAEAVRRITAIRSGNYLVFLPSFEFMENVVGVFDPPAGFTVLTQERGMKQAGVDAVLEHLRSGAGQTIIFAVQGGSFSEGVDYAGEMVIGAFVVGPPLPTFDLEREEMRKYYERKYGEGFEYAYTIPAKGCFSRPCIVLANRHIHGV